MQLAPIHWRYIYVDTDISILSSEKKTSWAKNNRSDGYLWERAAFYGANNHEPRSPIRVDLIYCNIYISAERVRYFNKTSLGSKVLNNFDFSIACLTILIILVFFLWFFHPWWTFFHMVFLDSQYVKIVEGAIIAIHSKSRIPHYIAVWCAPVLAVFMLHWFMFLLWPFRHMLRVMRRHDLT